MDGRFRRHRVLRRPRYSAGPGTVVGAAAPWGTAGLSRAGVRVAQCRAKGASQWGCQGTGPAISSAYRHPCCGGPSAEKADGGVVPSQSVGPEGQGRLPEVASINPPASRPGRTTGSCLPNHTAQGRRRAVVLVPCGRRLRRCAAAGARRGGRGAFQWLPSRDSRPGAPLPGAPIPDRWRSASCRVACRDEARAWLPMRIRAFARSSAWDQPDTISSVEASDGVRFHWQAAGPRSGLELRSTRSTAKKTMVLAERTAYLRKGVGEWVTMGA